MLSEDSMVVARGNTRIFQKTGNTRGIKGLLTFTPEHVCSFIKLKSNKKYCHNTQEVTFAKSGTCRNSLNVTVNYSKLIPRSFQLIKQATCVTKVNDSLHVAMFFLKLFACLAQNFLNAFKQLFISW